MEVIDKAFQSIFKILLVVAGSIFFCIAMIQNYGQFVFVLLLVIAVAVCLRLRNWAARTIAVFFIFVVAPATAWHVWDNTSPFVLFILVIVVSLVAYGIRERRLNRKAPAKTSGAERTPVFPPGGEAE